MLPPEITITDSDINYAESVLFTESAAFDDAKGERKAFIKSLDTIDLQAVPGSGKTTVLLAKLLILEKHLPFEDGSGILVISHTNIAVDEIRNRIATHCPKLFSYPNFVGTIQSFVDQFVAIPYYSQKHKKRLWRIDDEIYNENVYCPHKAKVWLDNHPYQKDSVLYKSRLNIDDELVLGFGDSASFPLKIKTSDTYISLLEMKQSLRERGILCYDDAYILAMKAIKAYPILKLVLRKRFRYVFVDEMQDMDTHQHDLLEQLFFINSDSSCVFQRIGDKNQAIYSGEVKIGKIWESRAQMHSLTGSLRLSPTTARVVESFGMPRQAIDGKNVTNSNGTKNDIPPHVIIFDDNSVLRVLEKFCELVKKYQDEGRIPTTLNYPIKAIAWRKGDDGKFGLKNYCPDFEAEISRAKIDYSNLSDYFIFMKKQDSPSNALESIYKRIMNGLLKLLRIEEVKNPDSKIGYFTIGSLQRYLREKHKEFYEEFRLKLFRWCRDVYAEQIDNAYSELIDFTPRLLALFGIKLEKSAGFVNGKIDQEKSNSPHTKAVTTKGNVYRCKKTDIEVQIGTVHSVKGETHSATLYLESYYQNDGTKKNPISHESQRLSEQFKGTAISDSSGIRTKQSARMVYVGFSRPTHLLCFACHKNRFDRDTFAMSGWQIEEIY